MPAFQCLRRNGSVPHVCIGVEQAAQLMNRIQRFLEAVAMCALFVNH